MIKEGISAKKKEQESDSVGPLWLLSSCKIKTRPPILDVYIKGYKSTSTSPARSEQKCSWAFQSCAHTLNRGWRTIWKFVCEKCLLPLFTGIDILMAAGSGQLHFFESINYLPRRIRVRRLPNYDNHILLLSRRPAQYGENLQAKGDPKGSETISVQ